MGGKMVSGTILRNSDGAGGKMVSGTILISRKQRWGRRGQSGCSRIFEALNGTRGTFACPRFPTGYSTKQPVKCLAALRRPSLSTIIKTPP